MAKAMLSDANYPKCVNCLSFDCHAGLVSHKTEYYDRHNPPPRLECLFNCGCLEFKSLEDQPMDMINQIP
jgi:hypothetical protein